MHCLSIFIPRLPLLVFVRNKNELESSETIARERISFCSFSIISVFSMNIIFRAEAVKFTLASILKLL